MTVLVVLASAVLAADIILLLPARLTLRYAGGRADAFFRAGPLPAIQFPRRPERLRKVEKTGARDLQSLWRRMPPPLLRLGAEQLFRAGKRLRGRVRLERLRLHLTAGGPDPYDVVMTYGRAALAMEALESWCAGRAVDAQLCARADLGGDTALEAALTVTVRLGYALGAAVCFGTGFLRGYFRYRRKAKTEG